MKGIRSIDMSKTLKLVLKDVQAELIRNSFQFIVHKCKKNTHTQKQKEQFQSQNQESKKRMLFSIYSSVVLLSHNRNKKREISTFFRPTELNSISKISSFFQQISLILIRFRFNIFTHTINNAGVFLYYTLVSYSFRVQSKSILVSSRFLKSKTIKFLIYFCLI